MNAMALGLLLIGCKGPGAGEDTDLVDTDDTDVEDTDVEVDDEDLVGSHYAGLWAITEAKGVGDDGGVIGRDTDPGIIGNIRIFDNGDGTGGLDIQSMDIEAGVPTSALDGGIEDISFEPGVMWVELEHDRRQPYTVTLDGDTLRFDLDASLDEGSSAEDGPEYMVLTRLDPANSPWVGDWDVSLIEFDDGEQTMGECTANDEHWEIMQVTLSFDDRFRMHEVIAESTYSDSDCSVLTESSEMVIDGMLTEEDGRLGLWAGVQEEGEFEGGAWNFAYALDGSSAVLTDPECGDEDCDGGLPARIEMSRR